MTVDREQIRRALAEVAASDAVSQGDFDAICDAFPSLLAELQQVERDRDEDAAVVRESLLYLQAWLKPGALKASRDGLDALSRLTKGSS